MWSAQQQSMLNAMGYTLYARPNLRSVTALADAKSEAVASSKANPDSALFKAVMKAVSGKDISSLEIDLNALRNSPDAKRVLWPHLRKLIKS